MSRVEAPPPPPSELDSDFMLPEVWMNSNDGTKASWENGSTWSLSWSQLKAGTEERPAGNLLDYH